MERWELSAREVGSLLGKEPQTIRCWMCGARNVPKYMLKLLESKINAASSRR